MTLSGYRSVRNRLLIRVDFPKPDSPGNTHRLNTDHSTTEHTLTHISPRPPLCASTPRLRIVMPHRPCATSPHLWVSPVCLHGPLLYLSVAHLCASHSLFQPVPSFLTKPHPLRVPPWLLSQHTPPPDSRLHHTLPPQLTLLSDPTFFPCFQSLTHKSSSPLAPPP